VARSAATRWSAERSTGHPDRSSSRHILGDDDGFSASGIHIGGDGSPLPAATPEPDQEGRPVSTQDNPWAALSEADRQRLGRHFSRLLMLAVRSAAHNYEQETLR
jgi:hypothetical protein